MPVFEFETPQGRFQVEAPDQQAAMAALKLAPSQQSPAAAEFSAFASKATGDIGRAKDIEDRANLVAQTDPLATKRGLKIPFSDEVAAAVSAPAGLFNERGMGEEWQREMEAQQTARDRFDAANPVLSPVLGVAGALGSVGAGPAAATMTRGAAALQGLKQGALGGAIFGGAEGQGLDRAVNAGVGGALGAGIGGIAGAIAGPSVRTLPKPSPAQETAAAAERLGIKVPKLAATDSKATQRVGRVLADQPFIGTPIERSVKASIGQQAQAVDDIAARAGNAGDRATAGRQTREALTSWIGPQSKARMAAAYGEVDKLIDPAVTSPLASTAKVAAELASKRQQAALPAGSALAQIDDALGRPGGLTYEGLKTLRTRIGEQMDTGILPPDMSKADLKRIYGALSTDLRSAASRAGGPEALKAFERANRLNAAVSTRREALAKVLGTKADEQVFDTMVGMAQTGGRANLTRLMQALRSMGPEDRGDLAATAISRLGQATDGTFSPSRFVTDYSKMTASGKSALFGPLTKDLDDLAKVATSFRDLERLSNPSGSGRYVGILGAGAGLAVDPVSTIGAALGGRTISALLARPASVKGMVRWSSAYRNAIVRPSEASARLLRAATTGLAATAGREAANIEAALLSALGLNRSAPSSTVPGSPAQPAGQ